MPRPDLLTRTLAKLRHDGENARAVNAWCGYLTSAEVVALVQAGAKVRSGSHLTDAQEMKSKGVACPGWVYLTLNLALQARMSARDRHA